MPDKIVRYVAAIRVDDGWEYIHYPNDWEGNDIWNQDLIMLQQDIPTISDYCNIEESRIVILKETTEEV